MYNPFEKIIYVLRDFFWNYPDKIFFTKQSLTWSFFTFYLRLRPFSHVIFSTVVLILVALLLSRDITSIVSADTNTLIEGVLVGVDENGNKNTIQKVNPLVLTNIQIEKDLNELIYEPLVEVDQNNQVNNILAETIAANERGDNFRFKLREDVYWHDGSQFTARDVQATFELLERLDSDSSTKTIFSTVANKRIKYIPIEGDNFRFEFQLEGVIPNFYELISFKIMPAKYIEQLNSRNIFSVEEFINSNPIGTGKFKLKGATEDEISLRSNLEYYQKNRIPQIDTLIFRFFVEEGSLIKALKNGQIHSVAGLSSNSLSEIKPERNIRIHKTDVIYNQYYALYFNLSENGSANLKDLNMRKAISSSINRKYIIDVLEDEAEEAFGPIAKNSFAFSDVKRYGYNEEETIRILNESGWILNEGNEYRTKDGNTLEFNMLAIDNVDRNKVSDSIAQDLKKVGIKLNVERKSNRELINEHILNRNFELLLYSMTTFVDPDRFELFHSSQITHPGLNLSSYTSAEKTIEVVTNDEGKNETQTVPEVDSRLEKARGILDEKVRKGHYDEFQRIIAEEIPVVFLYHPKLNYSANKRVRGVDLTQAKSLEERFDNIDNWYIQL